MLMSWPLCALVAGVKIGSGSRSDSRSPAGSRMPQTSPVADVVLPARSRQIAARDALDRQRLGARDQHRSAAQQSSASARASAGIRRRIGRRARGWRRSIARPLEPERRDLRQHLALVGNAGAEHVVERGDAIGGDDQQAIAEIVDVADLALAIRAVGRRAWSGEWARRAATRFLSGRRCGILQGASRR